MKNRICSVYVVTIYLAGLFSLSCSVNVSDKATYDSQIKDIIVGNESQLRRIIFDAPKMAPNRGMLGRVSPSRIHVRDRGEVEIETLKEELLKAGIDQNFISSIGDGSDPIFQDGRYGVRPPRVLMEIVRDFSGWKLYEHMNWFSTDFVKKEKLQRYRALKIEYPYEVISPRLALFENKRALEPLSEKSFYSGNCWIFPLSDGDAISGQVSFGYDDGQWKVDGCKGLPSTVLEVEKKNNLRNAAVRRLAIHAFGDYQDIIAYVPRDGRLEDGVYYFWENRMNPSPSITSKPKKILHQLNFRGLEALLRHMAIRNNISGGIEREKNVDNVDKNGGPNAID